jgi:hypothetical protein
LPVSCSQWKLVMDGNKIEIRLTVILNQVNGSFSIGTLGSLPQWGRYCQ